MISAERNGLPPAFGGVGEEGGPGSRAAALSNQMVRLFAHRCGRGPTKARSTLSDNLAVVVMRDTLTRIEMNLIAAGEAETVHSMRRVVLRGMREDATAAVEAVLGRTVSAYMADVDTDANVAIVAFVLEPLDTNGSVPRGV